MILQRVEQSEWLSNAYLAVDEVGGTGVLIDSNLATDPLCERVEREGTRITHILLTHHHHDHVVGVEKLAERFGGVPVLAHPQCKELVGDAVTATIDHGDVLETGGLRIEAIHTPGHCGDHLALRINDDDCLTADVIFKGTVGGTGAPGATGLGDLKASVMDRVMSLPNDVRIHPGHREPTTVIEEWENNPFIRLWRGLDEPTEEPLHGRAGRREPPRRDAAALGARLRRRQQSPRPLRRRRRRDDHRRISGAQGLRGSAPMPVSTEAVGKEYPPTTYEVGLEKIREYANAVGEAEPVHHDREAAKAAGFRDVVAPPMFAVVYSSPALGPAILDPEVGINFAAMVHGGQEFDWGEPVCAGDEITTAGNRARDLREGRQGLLRLRVGLDQPGRRRGRPRHLDEHRPGRLRRAEVADLNEGDAIPELRVTPDKYLPHRYAGASGDFNPIHIDNEFAQMVGLPRNILHGLYSMAQVARAQTEAAGGDPRALRRLRVQFRGMGVPEQEIVVTGTVKRATATAS